MLIATSCRNVQTERSQDTDDLFEFYKRLFLGIRTSNVGSTERRGKGSVVFKLCSTDFPNIGAYQGLRLGLRTRGRDCISITQHQPKIEFQNGSNIHILNDVMGQINNEIHISASQQIECFMPGKQYILSVPFLTLPEYLLASRQNSV